jgi:hypothetical protein
MTAHNRSGLRPVIPRRHRARKNDTDTESNARGGKAPNAESAIRSISWLARHVRALAYWWHRVIGSDGLRWVSAKPLGPGRAGFPVSARPRGALVRRPALRVRPQAQDAVLDRSPGGRRAIRWHGEPDQLGAEPGGRLAEDDCAEHQLEQNPVELRGHRTGTGGADDRT